MTGGESHRCGAEAPPWRAGDRRRTRVRPLLRLRRTCRQIDSAAQESLKRFRGAPADWPDVRARDDGSEDRGSGPLRACPARRPAAHPAAGLLAVLEQRGPHAQVSCGTSPRGSPAPPPPAGHPPARWPA